MRILAVSGSLRRGSSIIAPLEAARRSLAGRVRHSPASLDPLGTGAPGTGAS